MLPVVHTEVVVSSPATIANFGPGFDCFGLCLEQPRDIISMSRKTGNRVIVRTLGRHKVPTDPERNTASHAAMRLAELCGCGGVGFSMTIRKGTRPGSGLGSSAASAVGGAVAMAALLCVRDRELMLEAAGMGEEVVAGSRHFDNVAAALYGGFTVVSDQRTRTVLQIRPPPFKVVVALPEIQVETRKARDILPDELPLGDAVCNLGWASGMVHAIMRRNVKSIGTYMDDRLALPYRRSLVPAFDEVRESALEAGALGFSIGGSGPAVFAVATANAQRIRRAMVDAFRSNAGLKAESFITVPGKGAKVESLG